MGAKCPNDPLAPLLYISMLPRLFPCYLNLSNWTWSTHFTCKPLKILMTCQAIWNILKYVLLDICKIWNIPSWILRCEPKQTYNEKTSSSVSAFGKSADSHTTCILSRTCIWVRVHVKSYNITIAVLSMQCMGHAYWFFFLCVTYHWFLAYALENFDDFHAMSYVN